MSKFKSYKQTCALIREAKKEHHRVTEFLVAHTPIESIKLAEFDTTGTLSHLLLLFLARLEETSKAFPRLGSNPPPTLPETAAERRTAFCQERRKSSQRQKQDRSSQATTKLTTSPHSGDREKSKSSYSLVMDVARISDRSITRSVGRREEVKHSNQGNLENYSRDKETTTDIQERSRKRRRRRSSPYAAAHPRRHATLSKSYTERQNKDDHRRGDNQQQMIDLRSSRSRSRSRHRVAPSNRKQRHGRGYSSIRISHRWDNPREKYNRRDAAHEPRSPLLRGTSTTRTVRLEEPPLKVSRSSRQRSTARTIRRYHAPRKSKSWSPAPARQARRSRREIDDYNSERRDRRSAPRRVQRRRASPPSRRPRDLFVGERSAWEIEPTSSA